MAATGALLGEDPGGYDCEFIQPPSSAFQTECPICLHILKEPCLISCPCGQKICRECVEKIKEDNKPCPLCNKTNFTFMRDYGLERSLKEFLVLCSFKNDGCEWKGKLGEYRQHLNWNPSPQNRLSGCKLVSVECEHGCGEWLQRRHITAHVKEQCMKRPYSCSYCQEYESTYEDVVTSHFSHCNKYPVMCPNNCREEKFERSELQSHLRERCPLAEVNCPLLYAGCEVTLPRKDMPEHMKDTVMHLALVATVTQSLIKENHKLRQNIETRDQGIKETVAHLSESLIKENHELKQKVKDRDSKIAVLSQNLQAHKLELKSIKEEVRKLAFHKLGLPVEFRVKDDENDVYLPGFYTHSNGYRMCVGVVPRGVGDGQGTHVSIFTYLQKGQFDDHLKWPFRGRVTIQIVNQAEDNNHFEVTIPYDDSTPDTHAGRVVGKRSEGWGHHDFISHSDLSFNAKRRTQYSKRGIIIVRVSNVTLS